MADFEKQIGAWMYGLLRRMQHTTEGPHPVHFSKYLQAVLQKGGCEGWVQVELAILFESMPWCVSVERERALNPPGRKAVDFLLGYREQDGRVTPRLVELKCESLFHSADLGHVTMHHSQSEEVQKDVEKLLKPRSPALAGAPSCVLVVTFSQEAERSIDHHFADQLARDAEIKQVLIAEHFGERYRLCVYAVRVT